MAQALLTRTHRRDLRILTGQATNDLRVMWRDFGSADAARSALLRGLPLLVSAYGSAAATLGADYFDEARDAAGVRGRFRAEPVETVADEALDVLARVAVGPMFGANPRPGDALTLAQGGLQRHIANADRETVRQAAVQDRRAGWVRVGDGGCDWCARYLDGEVHYVEGYDFAAHDHCNCSGRASFRLTHKPPLTGESATAAPKAGATPDEAREHR